MINLLLFASLIYCFHFYNCSFWFVSLICTFYVSLIFFLFVFFKSFENVTFWFHEFFKKFSQLKFYIQQKNFRNFHKFKNFQNYRFLNFFKFIFFVFRNVFFFHKFHFLFLQKHIFWTPSAICYSIKMFLFFINLIFTLKLFLLFQTKNFHSAIIFFSRILHKIKISCTFNRTAKNELQTFPFFFKFQITNSSDIIFLFLVHSSNLLHCFVCFSLPFQQRAKKKFNCTFGT